jgi:hypothetical protein
MILLRKPGDLPVQIVEPADGVFRDGERAAASGSYASSHLPVTTFD